MENDLEPKREKHLLYTDHHTPDGTNPVERERQNDLGGEKRALRLYLI